MAVMRDPGKALLWAWLVPGAGHWYTARRGRAALYAFAVAGVFVVGLCMGGPGSVSVCKQKWAFLLQIFDGPMTIIAALAPQLTELAARLVNLFGSEAMAASLTETAKHFSEPVASPSRITDLGLTFTLVSAAFNVLVMADAYYLADKPEDEEP